MWVALAAAGFFGLIVPITLLRADRSAANTALTITTLLAVGVAVAATIGGNGSAGRAPSVETRPASAVGASLPALACLDDLAGDTVLSACEKALFGSAESVAAAVSYAASQLERLTTYGDVASANKNMTADLAALRRAVERDRYGLVAQVLAENYRCTPTDCPAFRLFSNRRQVMANMEARAFDSVVARYATSWNTVTSAAATASGPAVAGLGPAPGTTPGPAPGTTSGSGSVMPTLLTGKPTNADFPTSASTPPVSIMNPEPGAGQLSRSAPPVAAPTAPGTAAAAVAPTAVKKPPAPKPPRTSAASAPVQLSPAATPPPALARE
jgi:hypothetical protein